MKIQPQLFITPKNNTPNHSQVKSEAAEPISNKLYNPIYYRDYNISFGARLFRTPANFYAQPFNQTGMPQTMKTYLNDDYEDRQNMPPAQMMKIVFEPLKYADNLEEGRLLVASNRGFLPIESLGTLPPVGASIRRLPVYQGGQQLRRNYCVFWRKDKTNAYIQDFANILQRLMPPQDTTSRQG